MEAYLKRAGKCSPCVVYLEGLHVFCEGKGGGEGVDGKTKSGDKEEGCE